MNGLSSEENALHDSNIVPEERPNHLHLEQMWVILYSRPSGIAVGEQTGTAQGELGQALVMIERHVSQEWKKGKKQLRLPAIPGMRAGDLEDMGILVGEVYDESIIENSSSG